MAILQLPTALFGQVGINPVTKKLVVSNTLVQATTAGFLNAGNLQGYTVSENDQIELVYNANNLLEGDKTVCAVSITNGIITLVPDANEGNVVLPVTADHIAVFADSDGVIKDPQPGDQEVATLTVDALSILGSAPDRAILSMRATANSGSFYFQPASTPSSYAILNPSVAIPTIITLTDPGTGFGYGAMVPWNGSVAPLTTGNLIKAGGTTGQLVDAGCALKAQTTATYAGGGTSNAFTATGLTTSSIVTAVILTSANSVSITKAVPTANTLTITFSADPGAGTTVSWIAVTPAV